MLSPPVLAVVPPLSSPRLPSGCIARWWEQHVRSPKANPAQRNKTQFSTRSGFQRGCDLPHDGKAAASTAETVRLQRQRDGVTTVCCSVVWPSLLCSHSFGNTVKFASGIFSLFKRHQKKMQNRFTDLSNNSICQDSLDLGVYHLILLKIPRHSFLGEVFFPLFFFLLK